MTVLAAIRETYARQTRAAKVVVTISAVLLVVGMALAIGLIQIAPDHLSDRSLEKWTPIILVALASLCGPTIYFLPTWVASHRCHPDELVVLVINLCFGWMILGWLIALALALLPPLRMPQKISLPSIRLPASAELSFRVKVGGHGGDDPQKGPPPG